MPRSQSLLRRRASLQPVRTVISMGPTHAFFGLMPAYVRGDGANAATRSGLGAKLVTVVRQQRRAGAAQHLASILLLDPETGALQALLDGRYITEARTAAVSAVSSRLLARKTAKSLAIIGIGRPGAEPPGGAVASPHAATGHGVESEQTAPRRASSRRQKLPTAV